MLFWDKAGNVEADFCTTQRFHLVSIIWPLAITEQPTEVEDMELEHQPALDGFESHNSDQPVEETDTFHKETVALGLSEVLVDPTVESIVGNGPLDDAQETQEGDPQAAQMNGCADGEPTDQGALDTTVGEEYPISPWAKLSPDMSPEQVRLLDEDVERGGIIDPPDVLDGQVVDGRHREAARKRAGMPSRYNFLPEETNIVRHLLSKNGLRGHYDENQRAVYGYRLYIQQFIEAGIDPEASSANLRNFISQDEITEQMAVSPRTMSSVSAVLSSRRTSCVSLKDAVVTNWIKASDAERILAEPEETQERAVAMALAGESTTVKRAVERIKQENLQVELPGAAPAPSPGVGGATVTLHRATVPDLIGLVEPESLDCILTFPSPDPSMRDRLGQLSEFAYYGLKLRGVMAILTKGQYLAPVMKMLNHIDLDWVMEMDYRPAVAMRSGPPHRVTISRMPLLIWGKGGFRLQGGDDVIEVPPDDKGENGNQTNARLDVGMALIIERLTSPEQIVCDPLMLDRSHSATAAWRTGRTFIGATDSEANLKRIRNRLAASGISSK